MTDRQAKALWVRNKHPMWQFIKTFDRIVATGLHPYVYYKTLDGFCRYSYFNSLDSLQAWDIFLAVKERYGNASLQGIFELFNETSLSC